MRRTRTSSTSRALVLGLIALLAACGADTPPPDSGAADAEAEITSMLQASAEAWNRGDLDAFLDDYQDSTATTFVGGTGVTRGLDEIRARYEEGYWSSGSPEQSLRFEELEVQRLGEHHALAIGRYVLTSAGEHSPDATGYFSLVLHRTAQDGWQIIHDHSSASP